MKFKSTQTLPYTFTAKKQFGIPHFQLNQARRLWCTISDGLMSSMLVSLLICMALFSPLYAQVAQNFEGITTTMSCNDLTCGYQDDSPNPTAYHVLPDDVSGGDNIPVSQVGSSGVLGFLCDFTPSRTGTSGTAALTMIDHAFGVGTSTFITSQFGTNAQQGSQAFVMEDTDGWVTMYFDYVNLTGTTNPMMSMYYFVDATSYENSEGANDRLYVRIDIDNCASATTITLIDSDGGGSGGGGGLDMDDGANAVVENEWTQLAADLSAYVDCRAQLIIEVDVNSGSEELAFDNISFTAGTREQYPEPACGDITVNSTADNLTAGDGNCTLREAIRNANAGADFTNGDCDCGNTIRFDASTNGTPITIALAGANESANATGDFDITGTLGVTIIGNGSSNTIIDGADLDRVFDVVTTGPVSIQALTIQNGMAPDLGGGILCATAGADISLDQVTVTNCEAINGGGISMNAINVSLTMTSCNVTNNIVQIGAGGGLEFYGSSLTVTDCAFNNNTSGTTGGAVEIDSPGGIVNFLRSCFVGNTAGLIGGGINHINGNLTLTNCTFSDNGASLIHGQGGALFFRSFDTGTNLSVINCTAAENTAAVGGGFSISLNGGNFDMINTILADNTASGGFGHDLYIDAGTLTTNTNNIVEDCSGICPPFFSNATNVLNTLTTCTVNGVVLCHYPIIESSDADGNGDEASAPMDDICGMPRTAASPNIGSSEATFDPCATDTENPIADCPIDITEENYFAQCGAVVDFTVPPPRDNCGATSLASPASGSFFNVGTTQVTVTATDGAGNTDQCTFDVVVNDTEDPSISCPPAVTQIVDASCMSTVPNLSVKVGDEIANSSSEFSGIQGQNGWYYGKYTAFNAAGFTQLPNYTGFVWNNPGTNLDFPQLDANGGHPQFEDFSWPVRRWVSDFSGDVTISGDFFDRDGSCGDLAHVRILQNGNQVFEFLNITTSSTPYSFNLTIAVGDEIDFVVDPKFDVACDDTHFTGIITAQTGVTASDNCNTVSITQSPAAGSMIGAGANVVTITATDASNNQSTCNVTVTVQDTETPTANCQNTTVNIASNGMVSVTPDQINNGSTDNCTTPANLNLSIISGQTDFSCSDVGSTFTLTLQVEDEVNNTHTCTADVTVADGGNNCIPGEALFFDGNNNFVNVPASVAGMDDFTVELWFKALDNGLGGLDRILSWNHAVSGRFELGERNGNLNLFTFTPAASSTEYSGPSIDDGQWHHVAITRSGNAIKVFLDGSSIFSFSLVYEFSSNILLGRWSGSGNEFWRGPMDELRIWNRVLCQDEIINGKDCELSGNENGLAAYYDFNQGFADVDNPGQTTLFDRTNNGNDGTLVNFQLTGTTSNWTAPGAVSGSCTPYVDNTDPIANCPGTQTVSNDAGMCGANVSFSIPDPTDNCSSVTSSANPASGSFFSEGTTSVTVTATDGSGNTDQCTFNVMVNDTENPTITCNGAVIRDMTPGECTHTVSAADAALLDPTSSDNCPGTTITYTLSGATTGSGGSSIESVVLNPGGSLFTFTATDAAGNTSSPCTVSFNVLDNQDPTISCPSNVNQLVDQNQTYATVNNIAPTANDDNCGVSSITHEVSGATTVTNGGADASGTQFNIGTSIVTYTVEDAAGNTGTCSFNVNISGDAEIDVQDPDNNSLTSGVSNYDFGNVNIMGGSASGTFTISNLGDVNLLLNGTTTVEISGSPSFSVTQPASTSIAPAGNTTCQVSYNPANDDCSQQTATISITNNDPDENPFTFIVSATPVDNVDPVANCPGTQTVSNDAGMCGANVSFPIPNPTDNCPGATASANPASGSFFSEGTTTVTVTATDAFGNQSTCMFDVVVNDTENPTANCPGTQTVSNDAGMCGANVSFPIPNPTDNCPGATSAANPASGSFFSEGTTTVTVTATDAFGNQSTCMFDVVVNDTENPTANCPGTQTVSNDAGMCGANVSFTIPNPTDNCPGATASANPASGSFFSEGTTTVTVTATDAFGNQSTCMFDVVVNDTENPTANCPGTQTVSNDAGMCGANVSFPIPNPTDNCPGATASANPASGSFFSEGTTSVTVTATDAAGNESTCMFDVMVNDTENPTANCPGTQTVSNDAGICGANVSFSIPDPTDNCPGATSAANPASGSFFSEGTTAVTVTATDAFGNQSTCMFDVVVNDTENPTANCPGTQTVNNDAGQCGANVSFPIPNPTDNCPGATASANPASGSFFSEGTTSVTVTATDAFGNQSTCMFDVVVNDTENPTANCPGTQTVSNDAGLCGANVSFTIPNPTDNCPGATASANPSSGSFFSKGTTAVTVTATDAFGNQSTCMFDVVVNDTEDPMVAGNLMTLNVEGCNATDAPAPYSSVAQLEAAGVTIADNCSTDENMTVQASSSTNGTCPIVMTRTYTVTDECGNVSASFTHTINIDDTTAPNITTQAMNLAVDCDGSGNMTQLMNWLDTQGGAQASDNCGFTWSNDFDMLGGGLCANSANMVTFTATDACGNTSTTSATFTIQDNEAPTVSGNLMVLNVEGCTAADAPAAYTTVAELENAGVTITDACSDDTNITVNVSASTNGTCPIVMTRTYTVTDACSNESASFTQTINIEDTTPPTIDMDAMNMTVECDGSGNSSDLSAWLASNGGAVASDLCGGVTWSNNHHVLSNDCGQTGFTTVTFAATDDCGNSSSTTATFIIEDTTPPTIDTDAMNQTVECDGSGNSSDLSAWLASNGGAVATDLCGGVTWSNNHHALSNDCGQTGFTTVTFTATDDCGNSSSTTATFIIEDTTPPTIDTDAMNQTVECDGSGNSSDLSAWLASNGGAVATDLCGGVTWSNNYTALSADCGQTGFTTVTFTATDDCGNSSSTTATFIIEDTTPPTIDTDAMNQTVECDGSGNSSDLSAWLASNGGAVASDLCGGVTWSNNHNALSNDCGETGSTTVTFTATDNCGNSSSTTATFIIEDTTPPSIDNDAMNETVECDGAGNATDLGAWLASNGGAMASDLCGNVTWSNNYTAFVPDANCPNTGSVTVTFTATDDCGNAGSTTATFTIEDTTPPTASCNNITVQLDGSGEADITVAQIDNNSNDLCCGLASLALDRTTLFCSEVPSTTVTLTATDFSGNAASCDATITVEDNVNPTAICQNATVEITPDGTSGLDPSAINNGSFDNCDIGSLSLSKTSFVCEDLGDVDVTLTVTDVNGNTASCTATVTVTIQPGLPGQWNGTGIGNNGGADPDFEFDPCTAADPADGEFNISSNGNNAIGTNSDNVAFAYQDLCGDFTITAKVESVSNNGYGGLMVRESSDAGAKQASIFSNLTNILRNEVRYTTNGNKQVFSFFKPSPIWLRMERQGTFIFFYYSTTGWPNTFQYVHAVSLPMNNCVQVGLASFSFIPGQQATATFSNVDIVGAPAPSASLPNTPAIANLQKAPALYPNPANQIVNLVFNEPLESETTVVLRNQLGQVIEQHQLQAGDERTTWDVSFLTDGLYYMEVQTQGRAPHTLKFVKAQ